MSNKYNIVSNILIIFHLQLHMIIFTPSLPAVYMVYTYIYIYFNFSFIRFCILAVCVWVNTDISNVLYFNKQRCGLNNFPATLNSLH